MALPSSRNCDRAGTGRINLSLPIIADEEFAALFGAARGAGVHGAVFGCHGLNPEALEDVPDVLMVVNRHQEISLDLTQDPSYVKVV